MPPRATPPLHTRPGPSNRALIVLIGLYLMLQGVSTDLYLASLPGLARTFAVPAATVQLTLSAFVLAFGAMQLVLGPVADRFGRYPVLVGGLVLYTLASVAAALAPSIEFLIGTRVVQAIGCCAVVVAARAIVRDRYDPVDGARVLARASTVLAVGPLVGPMLGSALEVRFGFRAAFVLLAVIAFTLLVATLRQLTETHRHPDRGALQPAAVAAGYVRVLHSPQFRAYTLVSAASYSALFAFISGSSFVLIGVLGVPTALFGLCFAFCVSGYLVGTLVCRRLLVRHSVAATVRRGAALSLAFGLLLLALMVAGLHHWAAVLLPMAGVFLAHGINLPCGQAGSAAPFPQLAGAAAGMFGFLMMGVAAAIGALIGATHDGTVYPMAMTVAACTVVIFLAAWFGVGALRSPSPEGR
jgi:DHA1 family bicyclomycin/chloramphenicol resistance-like MFS transporter